MLELGQELIQEFSSKFGEIGYQLKPAGNYTAVYPISWPLTPGDGVIFSKFSGVECTVDKITYRIVPFDEILCTVEEAENPEAYAVTTD